MSRAEDDLHAPVPSQKASQGQTPEDLEDLALSDDYALNPRYAKMVMEAADRGDVVRLKALMEALHPADVADLMGFLTAEYREEVIPCLPADAMPEILSELEDNIREEVLEHMPPAALARALGELES